MRSARPLVVVVDDSLVVRRVLESQLRQHGYDVVAAVDGESGLALCAARTPDVVLLDLNLPGMSGFDMLAALRKSAATADIPVIILSERQAAQDAARGLELGAHDYLRKPVHPLELTARVDAALRLKSAEDGLRRRNAELERVNRTDALTGLANRRHLDAAVIRECARAQLDGTSLGLLIVDLDHFKEINDMAGHVGGDAVLREIGSRIVGLMRDDDTAGRWGGDEFLVLMPGLDAAGLTVAADRLRASAADAPVAVGLGRELAVTVTIGGALFAATGIDDFIRAADSALYEGKHGGRNTFVLAPRRGTLPTTSLATSPATSPASHGSTAAVRVSGR